jgi:hypothetical protein
LVATGLAWGQAVTTGQITRTKPPPKSIIERQKEAAEQREQELLDAQRRAEEREANQMLEKYPDLSSVLKERSEKMAPHRGTQRESRKRREELLIARKTLLDRAEFYKGKPLPRELQLDFDANDGQLDGQKAILLKSLDEESTVVGRYHDILMRMSPLWSKQLR